MILKQETDSYGNENLDGGKIEDPNPRFRSTSMEISDSSSETDNKYEVSGPKLARRSSFIKPRKSIIRLPSMKVKRTLSRNSYRGDDMKRTLKKTRSIKISSFESKRMVNSQQSSRHSHSLCDSDTSSSSDQDGESWSNAKKPMLGLSSKKSFRGSTRRSGLTKSGSNLNSKRAATKDLSVFRATCSSALKGSKFADHVKLESKGNESEENSSKKVCTYTYCSLHGQNHDHRNSNLPPLKRYVSMRRRVLNTQKNKNPESDAGVKSKRFGNTKKGMKTGKMVSTRDPAAQETARNESRRSCTDDNFAAQKTARNESRRFCTNDNFADLNESLSGISSKPRSCSDADSGRDNEFLAAKRCNPLTLPANEDNPEFNMKKLEASASNEVIGTQSRDYNDATSNRFIQSTSTNNTDTDSDAVSETLEEPNTNDSDAVSEPLEEQITTDSDAVSEPSEEPITEGKQEKKDSEEAYGSPKLSSRSGDETPIGDVALRSKMEKQRNNRLWGKIYQHIVTGLTEETKTKQEVSTEEHTKDSSVVNISDSKQGYSEREEVTSKEDHDAFRQKIELRKNNAVKLVRQAFDKILSEIPDNSSDNQSVASNITSEQDLTSEHDLIEKNAGEHEDLLSTTLPLSNITSEQDLIEKNVGEHEDLLSTTFSSSVTDGIERELQEKDETRLQVDNVEEKTESKVGNKSNRKMPSNWSNLKKIITLRRFVKALEKVKNITPRTPRCLPVEAGPEAERISLKHQEMNERKGSEEWMLDYALRHVISTLAPSQKKKVALLVQAFETLGPLPDIGVHLKSGATTSSCSAPVKSCTSTPGQVGGQIERKNTLRSLLDKALAAELVVTSPECGDRKEAMSISSSVRNEGELEKEGVLKSGHPTNRKNSNNISEDQTEPANCCLVEPVKNELWEKSSAKCSGNSKVPENGEAFKEVPEEAILKSGSKAMNDVSGSGFNPETLDSCNLIGAAGDFNCGENSDKVGVPREVCEEEASPERVPSQESPRPEEVELSPTAAVREPKLEKERYTRLWYSIYKHMVSGDQQLLQEGGKERQNDDGHFLGSSTFESNSVVSEGDHKSLEDMEKTKLLQSEAIKLVEEAIDEIQLSDSQEDSPDDHESTTRDISLNQKIHKQKHSTKDNLFCSGSMDPSEDGRQESRERLFSSNNVTNQVETETASNIANKSKPKLSKSWSNLKKFILLKRFVKALEKVDKVRKFNPREPRYLPLNPDAEAEKVDLKHQNMNDRKNTEEWMLDYALQQVVTKLTPARRRKVGLLIEAFETVIPTIGK